MFGLDDLPRFTFTDRALPHAGDKYLPQRTTSDSNCKPKVPLGGFKFQVKPKLSRWLPFPAPLVPRRLAARTGKSMGRSSATGNLAGCRRPPAVLRLIR